MLTPDQTAKLHKAIDAATHPGKCKYTKGYQPCCVIGQLGALEGFSTQALSLWEGSVIMLKCDSGILAGYPTNLLFDLQRKWDNSYEDIAAETRGDMHELVDAEASSV